MSDNFKITEKQVNDANTSFKLFDKKGQGEVNIKDLKGVFKSLGLKVDDEKLAEWADALDEEATGHFTFEAFKVVYELKLKVDIEERELREAFRVLDKGNMGTIPVEDLKWILKNLDDDLTEDEIDDMITETDTDGSGTVDFGEFKNLMMSD